jgi:UDP-N-acetylglucosamine--N-acetylmuramyl-(pentapeptide) pyrophosphoryl-undecaprenol N-acetylglucosamine transferase
MRVMIAGGGTGGHIYPGIAMYKALKASSAEVEVLFVGAKSGVERGIFADLGLPNVLLPGRGVRGKGLLAKAVSPFVFLVSIARGVREVRAFDPDVVIGTGGFASVAVVAASVICRRRRILQEQNSVPGLANRVLSRFADLVLLSYEDSMAFLRTSVPTAVIGNPIRVEFGSDRAAAVEFLGLDPAIPTVLICGGSRGAQSINRSGAAAVPLILERRNAQFVFLTGERDHPSIASALAAYGGRVRVYPFLQEMHHAYRAADVAVSRAGASAVFELAAFGVPTVFVPYPYAADDHQRKNVAALSDLGAAVVVDDRELDAQRLRAIIEALLDDEEARRNMADRMTGWARPDAAARAAERIMGLVSHQERGVVRASGAAGEPGTARGLEAAHRKGDSPAGDGRSNLRRTEAWGSS